MKKIIVMICTGLFMTGIVSCNQQKGTTDNGNKAKNEQTVDAMTSMAPPCRKPYLMWKKKPVNP